MSTNTRNRNLRILLVSPRGDFLARSPRFAEFLQGSRDMRTILHYWNGISAALPTVAALTPREHEVTIIDENLEAVDFDRDCDIVGITAMTQQAVRAYEIAGEFRQRGRFVVVGGIHATALPEEALLHADAVIVGEAENSWPQLLLDFQAGTRRQVYRQSDYPPVDMTRVPTPCYELLAKYRYPVMYVQGTRGCPHDCEFCVASNVYGRTYRYKGVDQVIREVRATKEHWPHAQVGFADDNLFVRKSYSRKLVAGLADMKVSWYAQCDISVAEDESFLRDLRASGCRHLIIGLESVRKENLDRLNKNRWKARHLAHYAESIERIQREGIGVFGAFIFGLDADDAETITETVRFITDNHILGSQLTLLTPFPGSRLRTRLEAEHRILHSDWQLYTVWNAVIRHPNFSPEDMEKGLLTAYNSIYTPENNRRRAQYFHRICQELVARA
jgi:radical SAM superfamily enzyme YgiQ (UPF0313 family)